MKKNTGLVIVIIILGILILGLGGYIVYEHRDSNRHDENVTQQNPDNESNDTLKLDNDKEWVYDATYDLKTDRESYYGYSDHSKLIQASDLVVPYININSDSAKKANEEIYRLYENLIHTFNDNLKNEVSFTLVHYQTYFNDNVVSVVIITESSGTDVSVEKYYTYNFNLDNGNLLTYQDGYQFAGFDDSHITSLVNQSITSTLKSRYSNLTDFDTYNAKSIDHYNTSVEDGTIQFFIDKNKKLMLHSYLIGFYHPTTKEWLEFRLIPSNDEWKLYFKGSTLQNNKKYHIRYSCA